MVHSDLTEALTSKKERCFIYKPQTFFIPPIGFRYIEKVKTNI